MTHDTINHRAHRVYPEQSILTPKRSTECLRTCEFYRRLSQDCEPRSDGGTLHDSLTSQAISKYWFVWKLGCVLQMDSTKVAGLACAWSVTDQRAEAQPLIPIHLLNPTSTSQSNESMDTNRTMRNTNVCLYCLDTLVVQNDVLVNQAYKGIAVHQTPGLETPGL